MRRFTSASTAAVAAIALLMTAASTPAGVAARPSARRPAGQSVAGVGPAAFPTVAQVARIFRRTKAVRFFAHRRPLKLEADCLNVAYASLRPRKGRRALYTLAGGRDPYDAGLPLPDVTVYRFKSPKQARSTFAEITATFPPCYGTTNDTSGYGNDVAPLHVPGIGRARYGIRNVHRSPTHTSWLVEVWAVKGRCLTDTGVERGSSALRPRPLFALARLAVRSACDGTS